MTVRDKPRPKPVTHKHVPYRHLYRLLERQLLSLALVSSEGGAPVQPPVVVGLRPVAITVAILRHNPVTLKNVPVP